MSTLSPAPLLLSVGLLLCARAFAAPAPATAPAPVVVASVADLRARLGAQVAQPRFAGALWSVRVDSLDTGRTVFAHHADRLMSPASNTKLYTAALALDVLGPDYRIVTPLVAASRPDPAGTITGDVVVAGRGDPSWRLTPRRGDFWSLFTPFVSALRTAGVQRITGDLVADATWLHVRPSGAGWTADDLNDSYGAELSALSLEDNFADLRVMPAAAPGEPCRVEWLHPFTGLEVDCRVVTGPAGSERQVVARRLVDEGVVRLFGRLPAGGKEEIVEVTVPRPAAWFARALREALRREGIRVEGRARAVRWPEPSVVPAAAVTVAEVTSAPLRTLVAGFMKPSQNLETQLVFAHVGERRRGADTPPWLESDDLALPALREFLVRQQVPADDVRFEEGSGLSRNNLTTANATVALLNAMARHAAAADFEASLPVAGVDGTLRRRMKDTPAMGRVRAKTGTLRYANSLAGYVTTAAGERLSFCAMLNRSTRQPAGRGNAAELDEVAVWLAALSVRTE